LLSAAILTCLITGAAHAGGVADGEAGLKALQSGAYGEAIRLFTRAINAGDLSADDREFAYLNRGKAYLAKADQKDAAADLRQALSLKPDDTEARSALNSALAASGVNEISQAASPAQSTQSAPPDRWGLLSTMAGRYFWYQEPNQDAYRAFLHAEWVTPGQLLKVTIRSKNGVAAISEYKLYGATIISLTVSGNTDFYGTVFSNAKVTDVFTYSSGTPIFTMYRLLPDGTLAAHDLKYVAGKWQGAPDSQVTLVEVSQDILRQQGFLKKR
jgi:tetratricopeptide (TPR) repeat protein